MDARVEVNLGWAGEAAADLQSPRLQVARLEALGRRTSSIVHDFNNLLMVVHGNTALLRRKVKEPEAGPHLDAIQQVVERATALARELLTYARGGECGSETLDLAEAVEKSLSTVRQLVGPGIAVQWSRASEPAFVDICPVQLDAAVLNLAANARDAMPSGGVLELATRVEREFVELSISDTGAGVPPEILPRVFEAFFTTKASEKGTGLGLAQVNDVARLAGGSTHISSVVGQGTTVTLRLPRLPAPSDVRRVEPGTYEGEGRQVLLRRRRRMRRHARPTARLA